jgi:hypothetical protein
LPRTLSSTTNGTGISPVASAIPSSRSRIMFAGTSVLTTSCPQ